jgi:hypothetical protein
MAANTSSGSWTQAFLLLQTRDSPCEVDELDWIEKQLRQRRDNKRRDHQWFHDPVASTMSARAMFDDREMPPRVRQRAPRPATTAPNVRKRM